MILLEQLIDATNYEWAVTETGYAWIEGDHELGVEIETLPGGRVWVKNTEHDAGIELTESELLHYGEIAIDYVQFIDYARGEDYSFRDVADALVAMGCDYGFTGSSLGLGISLPYGAWLDIESGGYRLWDESGFEIHAATPAGCGKAYAKLTTYRQQREWAAQQREKENA
jgi:hypothetical protein